MDAIREIARKMTNDQWQKKIFSQQFITQLDFNLCASDAMKGKLLLTISQHWGDGQNWMWRKFMDIRSLFNGSLRKNSFSRYSIAFQRFSNAFSHAANC